VPRYNGLSGTPNSRPWSAFVWLMVQAVMPPLQVSLIADTRLGVTDGWHNHGFHSMPSAGASKSLTASYYQIVGVDPEPLKIHEETIGSVAVSQEGSA